DAADDRHPVHPLRELRENLADLNPRDVGGDRLELAADLAGRIRLQVPHVLVGRAAGEEDVDDRLVGVPPAGGGFGAEHVGQRQAAEASERKPADLQELAPGNSVAKPLLLPVDRQHRYPAVPVFGAIRATALPATLTLT